MTSPLRGGSGPFDSHVDGAEMEDDDEYASETKVGEMPAAVIEQLMREAEAANAANPPASTNSPANAPAAAAGRPPVPPRPAPPRPPSKTVPPETPADTPLAQPAAAPSSLSELPDFSDEDDDAEPTRLHTKTPPPIAFADYVVPAAEAAVAQLSAAEEFRLAAPTLVADDDSPPSHDAEDAREAMRAGQAPAPHVAMQQGEPRSSSGSSSGVARAPRPAVFPEWLGVSFRPNARTRDYSLALTIAIGVFAFVITLAVLWALLL